MLKSDKHHIQTDVIVKQTSQSNKRHSQRNVAVKKTSESDKHHSQKNVTVKKRRSKSNVTVKKCRSQKMSWCDLRHVRTNVGKTAIKERKIEPSG